MSGPANIIDLNPRQDTLIDADDFQKQVSWSLLNIPGYRLRFPQQDKPVKPLRFILSSARVRNYTMYVCEAQIPVEYEDVGSSMNVQKPLTWVHRPKRIGVDRIGQTVF